MNNKAERESDNIKESLREKFYTILRIIYVVKIASKNKNMENGN